MNQKQTSNAQIDRTHSSGEPKPIAPGGRRAFETSVAETTANAVVEVSLT
jgi:hypothetical protein